MADLNAAGLGGYDAATHATEGANDMLRGILTRLTARRRTAAPRRGVGAGPTGVGGTANQDIERGARSLFRGLSRKRRL